MWNPDYLIFPDEIILSSDSGRTFKTVVENGSSSENRYSWLQNGLREVSINDAELVEEEKCNFEAFIEYIKGEGKCFLFFDPQHNRVENQVIGIGDGSNREFQLIERVKVENKEFIRDVRFPDSGYNDIVMWNGNVWRKSRGITITKDNSPSSSWSLQPNGKILFSSSVASNVAVRASYDFYTLMRLAQSKVSFAIKGSSYSVSGIQMIEPNGGDLPILID